MQITSMLFESDKDRHYFSWKKKKTKIKMKDDLKSITYGKQKL